MTQAEAWELFEKLAGADAAKDAKSGKRTWSAIYDYIVINPRRGGTIYEEKIIEKYNSIIETNEWRERISEEENRARTEERNYRNTIHQMVQDDKNDID